MDRTAFFVFFWFVLGTAASAQTDTFYIETNQHTFSLRLNYVHPWQQIQVMHPVDGSVASLVNNRDYTTIEPVVSNSVGIGGTWRNVAVNFIVPLEPRRDDPPSTFMDVRLNLSGRRYFLQGYYGKFEGLYNYTLPPCDLCGYLPFEPESSFKRMGGQMFWVFNSNEYTLNATRKYSERQKHSAGSPLVMAEVMRWNLNANVFSADTAGLFPYFGSLASTGASVFSGYAYTLVYRRFFLDPILFVGTGLRHMAEEGEATTTRYWDIPVNAVFRLHGGYNGKRYYTGFHWINRFDLLHAKAAKLNFADSYLMFFVGYKFSLKDSRSPWLTPEPFQ